MGLKFGLYGCAGTKTCAGYPGSQGYEVQDAELLASWDVDYWKHDNCYTPCLDTPNPQTCLHPDGNTTEWYAVMRAAIVGVEDTKVINFNLCQWGRDEVWTWGNNYGNSWRMSIDNWGDWASVQRIGSAAAAISEYSGPGGFNDLDMLVSCISDASINGSLQNTLCSSWEMASSLKPRNACTLAYGLFASRHSL